MSYEKQIEAYIRAHEDEMINTWQDIVNTPSKVNDKPSLITCCYKLTEMFRGIGFECDVLGISEQCGQALVGTLGKDRPGEPILFSGHYDTVPLPGDHPFRFDEEGHVRGLGSLDMKGGIVVAYYVCKALNEIGWKERPIKILFVGDEENGHQGGNSGEIIEREAKGALCAFNMETGLINNGICISRKGSILTKMTIHGIGSHSGNDFKRGRSAIREAAYKIPVIEALTDFDKGTTVATTLIEGGTVPNSIPPICTLTIDARIMRVDERQRILEAMKEISATNTVESCTTEYECHEYMPPFESSDENKKLAGFVSKVSEDLGMGEMPAVSLGGGSDASHIAMVGVPVICSMGVRGEFNHTEKEYALKNSMFERVQVLANVVTRIEEFEESLKA